MSFKDESEKNAGQISAGASVIAAGAVPIPTLPESIAATLYPPPHPSPYFEGFAVSPVALAVYEWLRDDC